MTCHDLLQKSGRTSLHCKDQASQILPVHIAPNLLSMRNSQLLYNYIYAVAIMSLMNALHKPPSYKRCLWKVELQFPWCGLPGLSLFFLLAPHAPSLLKAIQICLLANQQSILLPLPKVTSIRMIRLYALITTLLFSSTKTLVNKTSPPKFCWRRTSH